MSGAPDVPPPGTITPPAAAPVILQKLDTYDDLVIQVGSYLFGRTDLQAQIPVFLRLFEAKVNRKLMCRQMETRVISTIDLTSVEPEFISLPPDFQTMRRVRLVNGTDPKKPKLLFATGQQIDDLREKYPNPGQPIYFSVFGSEMELLPVPNFAYQVEMVYRIYITPLTAASETNWLFDLAPDAYLYGTLMEVAPYLHDDERIPVWAQGVQAALDGLNTLSEQALYNAGPLVMRRRGRGYG
jgi:hypothetical protein